ncbi:unnamed protein product [Clonostachys solani]|uniref:Uncharacterized protein n=1 Tax=Clonostachys solani TaxID=160281 RepID=A0A9P0ET80_9HYPO|nr:unnamed protein product [Clonostachys solani]
MDFIHHPQLLMGQQRRGGKLPRLCLPARTRHAKQRESAPPPAYQPIDGTDPETTTDKLRRLSHDFSTMTMRKRGKLKDKILKPQPREEPPPPGSDVTYLILMDIAPREAAPEYYRGEWLACLEFTTRDLPRLMVEGFFWDAGNVVPEGGGGSVVAGELRQYEQQFGFRHARVYRCRSGGDGGPEWTGTIRVSARELRVLTEFEIGMLSVDLVFRMEASCGSGESRQKVYQYSVQEEEKSFNAWYDEAVLKGWWPWP